ncbi:hypothetical protein DSOL_2980 [Desulfosporosinus metallidurans]|uniref:Uncharacterized protein n=1 Tax=Desulfosporosinus metallidurans TaxID=1888891 RepID=A0A1Q8QTS5_9FIRM|nr:hypothetical protein DSOL_2980 [Desulfosporosinus metallidurans]
MVITVVAGKEYISRWKKRLIRAVFVCQAVLSAKVNVLVP